MCVCVCVSECVRERGVCVCVCVCVFMTEITVQEKSVCHRGRKVREREGEK